MTERKAKATEREAEATERKARSTERIARAFIIRLETAAPSLLILRRKQ
jgi:hypothetical protein